MDCSDGVIEDVAFSSLFLWFALDAGICFACADFDLLDMHGVDTWEMSVVFGDTIAFDRKVRVEFCRGICAYFNLDCKGWSGRHVWQFGLRVVGFGLALLDSLEMSIIFRLAFCSYHSRGVELFVVHCLGRCSTTLSSFPIQPTRVA